MTDLEDKTEKELKEILNEITEQRRQSLITSAVYNKLISEIYDLLWKKKKSDYNEAYERARSVV